MRVFLLAGVGRFVLLRGRDVGRLGLCGFPGTGFILGQFVGAWDCAGSPARVFGGSSGEVVFLGC